jgi:hypothetical protein
MYPICYSCTPDSPWMQEGQLAVEQAPINYQNENRLHLSLSGLFYESHSRQIHAGNLQIPTSATRLQPPRYHKLLVDVHLTKTMQKPPSKKRNPENG